MRPSRRVVGLVALAAATALVLSACAGGGGTAGGGAGDVTGGAAQEGNDINPVDVAKLRQGGDFLWSINSIPPQFNRNQVDGTEADARDIMNAIVPVLFKGDPQGVLKADPDYLVSAEVTSQDPQVITYKLNPKFVWNDGRAADWTDFDAQWKALNGTNEAFLVAGTTGYTEIGSIAAGATPQDVVVTFANKYADWRGLFAPIYPKETNLDPAAFNEGWLNQPLAGVGAGPFTFDSIDATAQRLTLVPNPKWWGAKPVLDRIVYVGLDVAASPEAFANGSLSFFDVGPSVSNFQRANQVAGAVVRKSNGPNYRHITFSGAAGAILADPALRLAIMKGVNRDVITQSQIGPIVPDAKPLGNHIYVEGLEGYKDNSGPAAYDQAKARSELDALGWTLQGNVRMKDGKPLAIRDVIPTGVPTSEAEAKLVQQQLGEIGVQVNIEAVPLDNFFEQYVTPGNFDITHFSWLGTQLPISSSSGIYRTGGASGVEQNYGQVGNEKINQLLVQANAELDPAKQRDLANQLDQEIWAAGHSLLLYQRPDAIAVQGNVANFGAFGFADPDYTKIGFTP